MFILFFRSFFCHSTIFYVFHKFRLAVTLVYSKQIPNTERYSENTDCTAATRAAARDWRNRFRELIKHQLRLVWLRRHYTNVNRFVRTFSMMVCISAVAMQCNAYEIWEQSAT